MSRNPYENLKNVPDSVVQKFLKSPFKILERRPKPVRITAKLSGRIEWNLLDKGGKVIAGGETHNLILDQGLDQIAMSAYITQPSDPTKPIPIAQYVVVGTGSVEPAVSDVGLNSESARTQVTWQGNGFVRVSAGVYELTRYFEFDYGEANATLTEFGLSYNPGVGDNLFSRELFRDPSETPQAVPKTSANKLRINWTLSVTVAPTTFTAGSFSATDIGDVKLTPGDDVLSGNYLLCNNGRAATDRTGCTEAILFSYLARGSMGTEYGAGEIAMSNSLIYATSNASAATNNAAPPVTFKNYGIYTVHDAIARDAYVPGSFERTGGGWKWETGYGNDVHKSLGIMGAYLSYDSGLQSESAVGYIFDLDSASEYTKDNLHTLTVGAPTVSWGRA